ncbi:MAG TPA: hypothetical protein VE957_18475 [Terriglobales bacterium]|nr:hypothetical protein [Terriglobales bacterium]
MKLFRKVKMEGSYWGVFLVNANDATDRKLVSSTFDKERDAEDCAAELNRIVAASATVVTDSVPVVNVKSKRLIRLLD